MAAVLVALAPIAVASAATTGVLAPLSDTAASGTSSIESAPVDPATASVGDRVWMDGDHDGRQDLGETGVDGVTVTLLDGAGSTVATQTTRTEPAPGAYRFTGLAPGEYAVAFSGLPGGARFTIQGSLAGDGTDSDADADTGRTASLTLSAGEVDDTIDAGLWLPAPALSLEKRAQGDDADAAPGPSVPVGAPVGFDYLVTNTGNEPLEALVVTDDQGVNVTCPATTVAIGDTVACAGTDDAVPGPYTNVGTATATAAESGTPVTATDAAHYTGVAGGLDLELSVQGEDADTAAAAPDVRLGATVTYDVTVENTGSEPLEALAVDGGALGPVTCPSDELAAGASMDCTAIEVVAAAGLHPVSALATADGVITATTVTDTDPATYRGLDPRVSLLKEVLDPATGEYLDADADAGSPGTNDGVPAQLAVGATAHFRFTVANEGNAALTGAGVTDDHCDAAPALSGGDAAPTGVLDVGETWTFACTVAAPTDGFTNTATVAATSAVGPATGDGAAERATVVLVGQGAVSIDKTVQDPITGTFGDAATMAEGATATFRLRVTNSGDASLRQVIVRDARVPMCDRTFPGPLRPGEATADWTCTATVTTGFINTARVTAEPAGGAPPVADDDTATVSVATVATPDLELTKTVDAGVDEQGEAVFRLTVTNHGPGDRAGPLEVVDDLPAGLTYVRSAGSGWSCAATGDEVSCGHAGGLAEGDESSVWLTVGVDPGLGAVTNAAVLAGATDDSPANDTDTAVLAAASPPGGPDPSGPGPDGPGGNPTGPGPLALTGTEVTGLVLLGTSLIGVGLVLLVDARRRRRAAS